METTLLIENLNLNIIYSKRKPILRVHYIGDLKGTYKINNMFRFAYSQGFDHIDINKTQIQTDP